MYYTAQQICAQVAHLIMQLKYKTTHTAHTHTAQTQKGQTKWLASQKAAHNVICIYILGIAPLENTEGNNAANAAWQHTTPFLPIPLSTPYLYLYISLSLFGLCLCISAEYA